MELFAYPFVALLFVAIFTREVIAPASKNQCDRRWLFLSCAVGLVTVASTIGIGYIFSRLIKSVAIIQSAQHLNDFTVGALSFLIASFIFYWWHRATHWSNFLWRIFHQLHHSARRVEALTAFFAHPLDTAAAVLISSFASYVVLGASPLAAAIALFMTGAFDLIIHSDIKTPRLLGYFLQRPEMHTIHHAYKHHSQNYGLPVWDLLFRTWQNPEQRAIRVGFDDDKSEMLYEMLMCRNINA